MKRVALKILIVAVSLTLGAAYYVEAQQKAKAASKEASYVQVYYFHGNRRCYTCNVIEKNAKDAVENQFANEVKSGKLKWATINYQQPENKKYEKDYNLFNQTLVMAKFKGGKQVEWKACDGVWRLVRDQDKFFEYVKNEVDSYLKGL